MHEYTHDFDTETLKLMVQSLCWLGMGSPLGHKTPMQWMEFIILIYPNNARANERHGILLKKWYSICLNIHNVSTKFTMLVPKLTCNISFSRSLENGGSTGLCRVLILVLAELTTDDIPGNWTLPGSVSFWRAWVICSVCSGWKGIWDLGELQERVLTSIYIYTYSKQMLQIH